MTIANPTIPTATYPTRSTVPPIVCEPWCKFGDGHPDMLLAADQTCWGEDRYLYPSREPAGECPNGDPFPARIGPIAHRYSGDEEPDVYLHIENFRPYTDADVLLTPAEARELAAALVETADELDPGLRVNEDRPSQLKDVHRRIRNILLKYPAGGWNLEESSTVLDALVGIVQGRQQMGDAIDRTV